MYRWGCKGEITTITPGNMALAPSSKPDTPSIVQGFLSYLEYHIQEWHIQLLLWIHIHFWHWHTYSLQIKTDSTSLKGDYAILQHLEGLCICDIWNHFMWDLKTIYVLYSFRYITLWHSSCIHSQYFILNIRNILGSFRNDNWFERSISISWWIYFNFTHCSL